MALSKGDKLPDATMMRMGPDGPEAVETGALLKGRKVVVFGLPGAFTGTCNTVHLPSFMRTAEEFRAKGVDDIICVTVNDPFVVTEWSKATGAADAGVTILGDPHSVFTKQIGMNFSVEAIGFIDRSQRYAALVEDGVVTVLNEEAEGGVCDLSTGEKLLEAI